MQILQNVNIDWLGKTKYFVALSVILTVVGAVAMYQDGGPLYGIDFKGGTLVTVKFAQAPPLDAIRSGLAQRGRGDSIIQRYGDPADNEVLIQLEQEGDQDEALGQGRDLILEVLAAMTSSAEPGKQDFNAVTPEALAEALALRDPLALGPTAGDRYTRLAEALTAFRDQTRGGLVSNLDDLGQVAEANAAVVNAVKQAYYAGPYAVRNVEIVGPRVGAQLRTQAFWATVYAVLGMLVYIAFRFEWVYGTAAALAVVHDVVITLGLFAVFDYQISLTVIAALLTLVGYSMNDTIVIFDRMRENLRISRRESLAVIANKSINQTLARTALTSGLTFLTVLILFLFGGEVLRPFSFALVVGIVVGTYSSIGIAAALVVAWDKWKHSRGAGARSASGPSSRARQDQPEDARTLAAAGRR